MDDVVEAELVPLGDEGLEEDGVILSDNGG